MVAIESSIEYGEQQRMRFAKWTVQRVELERESFKWGRDSSTPLQVMMEIEAGKNLLDHMLVRGPAMLRPYGLEEQTIGCLRLLERVVNDISMGVPVINQIEIIRGAT